MSKRILAIGELLWDILPDERKLGGAPANFAYRMNEFGHPTILLSRLGNDGLGREALDILVAHGLSSEYIQVDEDYPTGTVDVFFDQERNPDYKINTPVAYDFLEWTDEIEGLIPGIDCLAFGSLVQRSAKTADTLHRLLERAENAVKFYDVNLRKDTYSRQIVEASLNKANIAKFNHHEALELSAMFVEGSGNMTDKLLKIVSEFNLDICLITLEGEGALAILNNGSISYSPGFKVKMEDPLGAGDAFSAAFLHEYFSSGDIDLALEAGNTFGALVTTQKGAMQALTRKDTKEFFESEIERMVKQEFYEHWQPDKQFTLR